MNTNDNSMSATQHTPGPRTRTLSATMEAALAYINRHGGTIERRQGGFWVHPGEGDFRSGMDYVSPTTVYALESRGLLTIDWKARPARAAIAKATGSAA
jgi:hypothetical protein